MPHAVPKQPASACDPMLHVAQLCGSQPVAGLWDGMQTMQFFSLGPHAPLPPSGFALSGEVPSSGELSSEASSPLAALNASFAQDDAIAPVASVPTTMVATSSTRRMSTRIAHPWKDVRRDRWPRACSPC